MRRAAKKDANHNVIANALRDVGYTVLDLSRVGDDCPDILIGGVDRRTGIVMNWLAEIKIPGGKLRIGQVTFRETWRGPTAVLRSVDDAYRLVGLL